MNENLELLQFIHENAKMGVDTLTYLIDTIKNKENKIKEVIERQLEGYEKFTKETSKILKGKKQTPKDIKTMAKMGSYIGIKREMMMDNSDAKIADMLIKGSTMGTVHIEKKIKKYDDVTDRKTVNLAKELLKFEQENIEKLKKFL